MKKSRSVKFPLFTGAAEWAAFSTREGFGGTGSYYKGVWGGVHKNTPPVIQHTAVPLGVKLGIGSGNTRGKK